MAGWLEAPHDVGADDPRDVRPREGVGRGPKATASPEDYGAELQDALDWDGYDAPRSRARQGRRARYDAETPASAAVGAVGKS